MAAEQEPAKDPANQLLDEVEQLTWALLDQPVDPEKVKRLETLIGQEQVARRRYLDCIQMHVDLREIHGSKPDEILSPDAQSPVLGFLSDVEQVPTSKTQPPVAE